jgi:hypothetical protein
MLNMLSKTLAEIFVFSLLIIVFSCKSTEVTNKEEASSIVSKTIILKKKTYNLNKSMVLVTSYKEDLNSIKTIHYKVLDSKSKIVLKEGVFVGMKLEWYTINQLQGYKYIGMVEQDEGQFSKNNQKNKNITIINITE